MDQNHHNQDMVNILDPKRHTAVINKAAYLGSSSYGGAA